jgi:VIT1/CCC1 family predicted Fe2+/Mn2+ transporter
MTRLLSIGPESPSDDERVIAKGYTSYGPILGALLPIGLAYYFGNTKELILAGLAVLVFLAFSIEGRLHDLCIRLRRTNILLTQRQTSRETGT